MPDLSHLWQRFLLASSLVVGLVIGAAATVFGYSNLATVDVRWSVFHIDGVPLWTVAVVPLTLVLVAGTVYHWMDGFHHFTEHMRHRRRVHELEAEVASLRAHMDQVLEMPDQSTSRLPRKPITAEPVAAEPVAAEPLPPVANASTPALPERPSVPAPARGDRKTSNHRAARSKRASLTVAAEPAEPAAVKTNGGQKTTPIASEPKD